MRRLVSRRQFLRRATAVGVGVTVIPEGLAFGSRANDRIRIAQIGCGGRGSWFVQAIPQIGERHVAMCDVDRDRASESFKKMPDVPKFTDYRRMLEEKDKEIDAVIVAAPDHIHAPAGVMAMRMGKPLYCEKPLTNTINEARVMRRVANETGVATQMGNQGTATHAFREQVEILQSGGLGEVREVYVWNMNGGMGDVDPPTEEQPIPAGLEWNLWLGPRKFRPFNRRWMRSWHNWREFGTQQLGNWAIHSANMQFKGLKIDSLWYAEPATKPRIRVRAEVSEIARYAFPKWEKIRYEIPEREGMPPVTVHWYGGLKAPGFRETIEPLLGRKLIGGGKEAWVDHAGCLVIGSEGKIHSTGHNSTYTILPEPFAADLEKPEPFLPRHGSHEREWIEACRGGPKALSNFDYGAVLTEFVLLGNVATQFDRELVYDPLAMEFVGDDEATAALRREHRKGWEVE